MKKMRFLTLALALVLLLPMLAACGGRYKAAKPIESYDEIFADVYENEDRTVKGAEKLSKLEDYSLITTSAATSDWLAVFYYVKPAAQDDLVSTELSRTVYRVYSFTTGEIYEYACTKEYTYSITVDKSVPVYTVCRTETGIGADSTWTVYDSANNKLWSDDEKPTSFSAFADLWFFEGALYREKDGVMTKETDVPENLKMNNICTDWNDQYYYVSDGSGLRVYDKSLRPVASWVRPTDAISGVLADEGAGDFINGEEFFSNYVLNDGNVLIQFVKILEDDATKYDFYLATKEGGSFKYDLITLLWDIEENKTKELKLDCRIHDVQTREEMTANGNEGLLTEEGFENVAVIAPIIDKQIVVSYDVVDLVQLTNKGKLGKSLKLAADQTAHMPYKAADGIFVVYTTYGYAFVNAEGSLLNAVNNTSTLKLKGNYIIGERAIYNLNMETVYDLVAKNAKVRNSYSSADAILIEAKTEDGYDIIKLEGGKETKIVSCTEASAETGNSFGMLDNNDSCYYIYDKAKETYTCYTLDGTEIYAASEFKPEFVCQAQNGSYIFKATALKTAATDTTPDIFKTEYYVLKSADLMK